MKAAAALCIYTYVTRGTIPFESDMIWSSIFEIKCNPVRGQKQFHGASKTCEKSQYQNMMAWNIRSWFDLKVHERNHVWNERYLLVLDEKPSHVTRPLLS
jgi:hypothetical protein